MQRYFLFILSLFFVIFTKKNQKNFHNFFFKCVMRQLSVVGIMKFRIIFST